MKTLNIILVTAIAAFAVNSCSDRTEDEVNNPATEKKLDLKPLKTVNNQGNSTAKVGDTIILQPTKLPTEPVEPSDPTNPTDPNEGDPKDVPPRK